MQGRKVSKVVKTMVVRGERMEKQKGDRSLAADLPSAREDFEKVSVSRGAGGKSDKSSAVLSLHAEPYFWKTSVTCVEQIFPF